MIDVIVTGVYGRMGRQIIKGVRNDPALNLVGAVKRSDHPLRFGEDLVDITIVASLEEIIDSGQVVIDFTSPEASVHYTEVAATHRIPIVIGTTGLNNEPMDKIRTLSAQIPIVYAPNMSLGSNLFFRVVADVARVLTEDYDVEIVEVHHKFKKDAPSGTASRIAEIIAEAYGHELSQCVEYGRVGLTGERKAGNIGIHSVRGGDVVGEHIACFLGTDERLEFTHRVTSREAFVRGALRAVKFVVTCSPGLYDMQDVLRTPL